MRNLPYLIAGIAASFACYLVLNRQNALDRQRPVDELAHKLQDAWADHHTVA